jgi:DNA invertase Pin-like site-specific DNA recombinase
VIYGYARVSTDGQSVAAQVEALTDTGAAKVFKEVASGAKTDRQQLRQLLKRLDGATCCW